MKSAKDLTGMRFNRWTVIERFGYQGNQILWKCRCDCGTEKEIIRNSLVKNLSKSCGCLRVEVSKVINLKHGASAGGVMKPEYVVWRSMLNRCRNEKDKGFKDYGGRGIKVCDRWEKSFPDFMADMGARPNGTSIDRIDNNKGYEPGNCRWASIQVQCNNRRSNHILNFNGESRTIAEWSRKTGVSEDVISSRVCRGKSHIETLSIPTRKKRYVTFKGEIRRIHEVAKIVGIAAHVISTRLKLGWDHQRATSQPVHVKASK